MVQLQREAVCARLQAAIAAQSPEAEELLWEALLAFEGVPFQTAKGLSYSYAIRGGEMFFSRKEKSITKATVLMTFQRAVELMRDVGQVSGPKKLGTFGASYLYPILIRLGVICRERQLTLEDI